MTQTVPSKSTANVFYQGTARPRVPHAVLLQSTGRPYYPRMDNVRPRTSCFLSSTIRTPNRPQRPKKIMKSIWVKKERTGGSQAGNPEEDLKDYAIIDSGCSGSMTGDKDKLSDFKEFKGGYVAFGNDPKGGRITGKGTIKTSCIDIMLQVVVLRFIQLFLNKQVEGVARPQDFIPSVTLPSKVFTFMRKHSPKFSCRITPLTPPMLEVVTALAAEEAHSESTHSRAETTPRDAQGTPSQSAAQASISTAQGTSHARERARVSEANKPRGTDEVQGTNTAQGATAIPKSPNDYTPTDASQTSGGDEGLLDLYALNREVRRLKKQTLSQAKQIIKLKTKLKKVLKMDSQWSSSHSWNKDEGTLSEEHYVQDDYTADPFFEDVVDKDAAVTPDLERKSDETEEINIEEKKASDSSITPMPKFLIDEAGPSSPIRPTQNIEPEEQFKVDEVLADISRPRGLSIPGPIQSQPQPQQPSQATDPKDNAKENLESAEWDVEEERKGWKNLRKQSQMTTLLLKKGINENFLKVKIQEFAKTKYPHMKELIMTKFRNLFKDPIKDFNQWAQEKEREMFKESRSKKNSNENGKLQFLKNSHQRSLNAQDKESLEGILPIYRAQDLHHLYRVVQSYYEHIPPTGLGLILLGDLTTIWETPETSDDDFWKNQEEELHKMET
ncbi:hypothetical protein Tco_0987795 [Tanacetum coccineum]